ncbi:hypothetical protein HID58_047833 [Brassica napus]|uniref:Uncharacterized protein n=1 Tax=Brassica napus TaxID=3708 RepID=A0ABQ8B0D7_BRANA|nr:hypothetical protein HID58_047833 [Brassica napus]
MQRLFASVTLEEDETERSRQFSAVPHSTLTLSASLGRTIQFVVGRLLRFWDSRFRDLQIHPGWSCQSLPSLIACWFDCESPSVDPKLYTDVENLDRCDGLGEVWILLKKVDEFKKMLKHAKEANDMHAGEVYGDKSILATEAKELENRLLNLSEEQNKSLHVLDEACPL